MTQKKKIQVLERTALLLRNGGYVKESFSDAIKEREVHYPTGLQLEHIGVAIPHIRCRIRKMNKQWRIAILKRSYKFYFYGE